MSDLVKRLRTGAKLFAFSGNEEEELAQAAVEAADLIEKLAQELGECSGGYQTLEKELVWVKSLLEEALPRIVETQTWDGHTTVEPGGLLDRMYFALGKK